MKKVLYYIELIAVIFIIMLCLPVMSWIDPDAVLERRTLMVDPSLDDAEPFCYLAKSTTTLSVMGSLGTQVTFDGSLYIGAAELAFFYGTPLKPILARNKVLEDGWIPIVHYLFSEDMMQYHIEAFAFPLEGDVQRPLINFVRITMTNKGDEEAAANFASAVRFTGIDHRFEHMRPYEYNPDWQYEMTSRYLVRDGEVIYFYPQNGVRRPVWGEKYTAPYKGRDHYIIENSETGFVHFEPVLEAEESKEVILFFPRTPIPVEDGELIAEIRDLDYHSYREKMVNYWQERYEKGARLHIPEKKVLEAHKASLMYTWQGIWMNDAGDWVQGVNKLQYRGFWLRDGAYILRNHDVWGHHDLVRKLLKIYPDYQNEEGLFLSWHGQLDGFGQALYTLAQHALITRNKEYAQEIFPHFVKAVDWLQNVRKEDEMNLMPPSMAGDNELIRGRYTGHNLWALLGVRSAQRLALFLGKNEEAVRFDEEYQNFYNVFMKHLHNKAGEDGVITPGLDTPGGQDWGNCIGLFPTEVLEPGDPRIQATLDYLRREKYQEGCMTYLGNIHHYLTIKATQNFLMTDQPREVLKDFYAVLLHMGSAHEMFEWEAQPWGDRDTAGNLPPHGWGAAMYNLLLRNMLVQERGGEGGLGKRDLHIFSAVSPEWVKPGENISLENAVTDLGTISQSLTFTDNGARLLFDQDFHTAPKKIVFHIPYFVHLKSFQTDAAYASRQGNTIHFTPDLTRAEFMWSFKTHDRMNYEKAVDAYKKEYSRRFQDYVQQGYEPFEVSPPSFLNTTQRKNKFTLLYDTYEKGIAVNKAARSSSAYEENFAPAMAVNGKIHNRVQAFWAGGFLPQWLEIDLEEPVLVDRLHIFPYWDGARYYQYTAKVSVDGENWQKVADMSTNTQPASPLGFNHEFIPVMARFVRINVTYNSENHNAHIVEVRVFEKEQ